MTALCPFTANYTAVVLTETLAIFLTTLTLLVFVCIIGHPWMDRPIRSFDRETLLRGVRWFFLGRNPYWTGDACSPGDAAAAVRCRNCALRPVAAQRGLVEAGVGCVVDGSRTDPALSAVGGAKCANHGSDRISRAAVRPNRGGFYSRGILRLDADVDGAIRRRVPGVLETEQSADSCGDPAGFGIRFAGGTRARGRAVEPLQQQLEDVADGGSRFRRACAGANGPAPAARLRLHSHAAGVRDVVYAADRAASVFGKALAAERAIAG